MQEDVAASVKAAELLRSPGQSAEIEQLISAAGREMSAKRNPWDWLHFAYYVPITEARQGLPSLPPSRPGEPYESWFASMAVLGST